MQVEIHEREIVRELVASRSHTLSVLLFLLVVTVAGVLVSRLWPDARPGRLTTYLQILVIQWFLFWYVRLGTRRAGIMVGQIVDQSSWSLRRGVFHVAVALPACALWMTLGAALGGVLRLSSQELHQLQLLLPQTPVEKALWVLVSLTVGFTEEFLYRGYLLRQFHALTGSLKAGLFLQVIVFGLAHAVLPWKFLVSTAVLAVYLGALAIWRRSLVPGMIVHAAIGIVGGLFSPK